MEKPHTSLRWGGLGKWQMALAGGRSILNKARSAFSVSAGVMFPVGSIPHRGQKSKILRPGSVGFPEDSGDFLRSMVEHVQRFGENHAGEAVGVANVR